MFRTTHRSDDVRTTKFGEDVYDVIFDDVTHADFVF